jgi:hypothetical protein
LTAFEAGSISGYSRLATAVETYLFDSIIEFYEGLFKIKDCGV